jgi:hypothetical protein
MPIVDLEELKCLAQFKFSSDRPHPISSSPIVWNRKGYWAGEILVRGREEVGINEQKQNVAKRCAVGESSCLSFTTRLGPAVPGLTSIKKHTDF